MLLQIASLLTEVEKFIQTHISSVKEEEIKIYLCKLGAVMICGTIERSLEIIILNKLEHKAQRQILNFVKSHFQRGTNYKCDAIAKLLNRFDGDWHEKFKRFVDENPKVEQGVSSCYGIRNSVAHGIPHNVGQITLQKYLSNAKSLIDGITAATN